MATEVMQAELEILGWTPAIGLDVGPQLAAATLLMKDQRLPLEVRQKATLRAAELLRRSEPEAAADVVRPLLDSPTGIGAEASRIMAEVAIAAARFDEARHRAKNAADALPDAPAVKLLLARLAALDGRERGIEAIDELMAEDTFGRVWPELAAEGLMMRARWRAELGSLPEALLDLAALEQLCKEHGAPFTAMFTHYATRVLGHLLKVEWRGNIYEAAAGALKRVLIEDVPEATMGAMPPWLHGLAHHAHHHPEPRAFSKSTLFIAQLLEGAADLPGAYQTYLWGSQLSARIDGPEANADIDAAFERFRKRVGSQTFTELSNRETERIAAFP